MGLMYTCNGIFTCTCINIYLLKLNIHISNVLHIYDTSSESMKIYKYFSSLINMLFYKYFNGNVIPNINIQWL